MILPLRNSEVKNFRLFFAMAPYVIFCGDTINNPGPIAFPCLALPFPLLTFRQNRSVTYRDPISDLRCRHYVINAHDLVSLKYTSEIRYYKSQNFSIHGRTSRL